MGLHPESEIIPMWILLKIKTPRAIHSIWPLISTFIFYPTFIWDRICIADFDTAIYLRRLSNVMITGIVLTNCVGWHFPWCSHGRNIGHIRTWRKDYTMVAVMLSVSHRARNIDHVHYQTYLLHPLQSSLPRCYGNRGKTPFQDWPNVCNSWGGSQTNDHHLIRSHTSKWAVLNFLSPKTLLFVMIAVAS